MRNPSAHIDVSTPTLPGTLADLILPGSAGARRIARDVALIVAGSLVVALFAQIKIPLGFTLVPVTGQTFAILAGNAVLYVPGLIQLNLFLPANAVEAWGCADVWQCGLLPFIAGDLAKLVVASLTLPVGWALLDRFAVNPRPPEN